MFSRRFYVIFPVLFLVSGEGRLGSKCNPCRYAIVNSYYASFLSINQEKGIFGMLNLNPASFFAEKMSFPDWPFSNPGHQAAISSYYFILFVHYTRSSQRVPCAQQITFMVNIMWSTCFIHLVATACQQNKPQILHYHYNTNIRIISHVTIDLAWLLLFWEQWLECYFCIQETIHIHVTLDSGLSQTLNTL